MTLDTLHLVLLVLALAGIGLAVWARQGAAPRLARLGAELDSAREERARATGEHERTVAALRADREAEGAAFKVETGGLRARAEAAELRIEAQDAAMRERQAGFEREREQFEKLQLETGQRFKSIADSALVESQKRFVELADETFKKHKEGAQGELGAMLKPIQETFGQFREKVEAIEKVRTEDRAQLTEQLRQVGETARLTHEVTGKLQTALAAPKGGGRWGEETLRNVLEMAGLSPYADFVEQASSDTEKGRQRPDVIVRMPGGRELVIDSKVSLEDYLAGCDEPDAGLRRKRMAAHAARVRAHVTSLSRKEYTKAFSDRVDFVAMFIPGENFYAAVLEHDREIFDFAARNNVVIVTPSTLVALAKSVAYGWRQEQMAKNAEEAARLGRELYERLAKMSEHMGRVGS
ncbi:MAG: DNA recombination protein RmuC, partial [Alphaproteobacteria bacterium]|nr:DNA recombination protein RmuC [Alphaproteobacteria bacterium]